MIGMDGVHGSHSEVKIAARRRRSRWLPHRRTAGIFTEDATAKMKGHVIKPRKLKGFRDCQGRQMRLRTQISDVLATAAQRFGFAAIDTPALEYGEVLLGEGGETDKQVYGFEDLGGRKVVLRYDLTVPLARFAAEHRGKYHQPLRRFQLGKVWRAEKPQKGRYREFVQGDFDILGAAEPYGELEILTIIGWCLQQIGGASYVVKLGHRQILAALCHHYFELDPGEEKGIFIILDKLVKIGTGAVVAMLEDYLGELGKDRGPSRIFAELMAGAQLHKIKEAVGEAASPAGEYSRVLDIFKELESMIVHLSQQFDPARVRFEVDISLARGLDYYTGVVFETMVEVPEAPAGATAVAVGSICSGGHYDDLVSRFSNTPIAGVGASFGVDRLVSVLMEVLPLTHPLFSEPAEMIFLVCDLQQNEAMQWMMTVALQLRQAGLGVTHVLAHKNMQKQFQQAARDQARWAVVLELAAEGSPSIHAVDVRSYDVWQHPVTIKDLKTQIQTSARLEALLRLQA